MATEQPASKRSKLAAGLQDTSNDEIQYLRPELSNSYNWGPVLDKSSTTSARVSSFKHAPMSESWDNFTVGMKVELPNMDCEVSGAYWIATVVKLSGYKALMRYEGFGDDPQKDFWLNLCCKAVHPVGWCATVKKPLVPPKVIQSKEADWKDYLVKRLTGSKTLPSSFFNKVIERVNECPVKEGMKVEVVNKFLISSMRVATVKKVVGKRLHLQYDSLKGATDGDFWCHLYSPVVHPVGWSMVVGHKIQASTDYKNTSLSKAQNLSYTGDDATPEMFLEPQEVTGVFAEGQKLEAIDPLNLNSVAPATIMKVLKDNYLMIQMDTSVAKDGSDWFCYHASSPSIFPTGFAQKHGIALSQPKSVKGRFNWSDYLKQTKATAVPEDHLKRSYPEHGFDVGMKLEAVDLMDARLICVATVSRVVGRLLSIHFDGWDDSYNQWIDSESPDIYPVGWCELCEYHLEGPKNIEPDINPDDLGRKSTRSGRKSSARSRAAAEKRKSRASTSKEPSKELSVEPSPASDKTKERDMSVTGYSFIGLHCNRYKNSIE